MKGLIVLVVSAVCFVALTSAASNPIPSVVTVCDALSDTFGCDPKMWKNDSKGVPLRLNCTMKGDRHMTWASKTIKSDCYKLIAGSEDAPITQYIPGQLVTMQLRVTCYGMVYRGILMYAVNGTDETKVGDWELIGGEDGDFTTPWTKDNTACGGSLMHATAELKPYLSTMYYRAPPVGTGKITFRVLIKYGDANTGDFFWPANEITLNEAPIAAPDSFFILGESGQSCDDACKAKSTEYSCDAALLDNRKSFEQGVSMSTICARPFLSACGSDAGTYDSGLKYCYYPSTDCSNRSTITTNCFTKLTGVQQFCACSKKASTGNDGPTGGATNNAGVASPASKLQGITALLSLAMFFVSPRTSAVFMVFLGLTSGHNWMNSPSRSSSATTFRPYKPATTDLPHFQVGPNQQFTMEWMANHNLASYFAVVHSKFAAQLATITDKIMDDYLNLAPTSGKMDATSATTPWQKFHRKDRNTTSLELSNGTVIANWYQRVIPKGDKLFTSRFPFRGSVGGVGVPNDNNTWLLQFTAANLAGDARACYKSDKYPWLECVAKFVHVTQNPNQPDLANFTIPGYYADKGQRNRYFIQYYWGAYRDVTDVDYFTDQQVTEVYGIKPDGLRWKRIDHCNFPEPQTVYDFSEIVAGSLEFCFNNCAKQSGCLGMNVVPLQSPLTAYTFTQPTGSQWIYPKVPGADILIPFNRSMLNNNTEVDRLMKMASPDKYACFNVMPREFTSTEDVYVITKDPLDPVFYSTCYWPYRGNMFPGYPNGSAIPAIDIPDWRYKGGGCVECESQARGSVAEIHPIWKATDVCINCDKEHAPTYKPAEITLNQVIPNTVCDGANGKWRNLAHHTCSSNDTCVLKQVPAGRMRGAFMGGGDMRNSDVYEKECQELVARNPACSNQYIWTPRASAFIPAACYCYASASCCGSCSPLLANGTGNVYELELEADPTCAKGVPSADGKFCCSASCGAGNCKALALPYTATPLKGFCNANAPTVTRSCKDAGAPCNM